MNRQQRRAAPAPLLERGLAHHRAGRLEEAALAYRQMLRTAPRHADGLHLLGVVALQSGQAGAAAELIGQAIAVDPGQAAFHCNLGAAFKALGALDKAVAAYRAALRLQPDYPEAHNNLATALREQGALDEAIACYRTALRQRPGFAEAWHGLGSALGDAMQAEECQRKAIALRPDYAPALEALGSALLAQDRLEEAVGCYRRAVALRPAHAGGHANLGAALARLGEIDAAVQCQRRAVALDPGGAAAHFNLGMLLLSQGALAEGWREYEWRWQAPHLRAAGRDFAQPQWRGEPAAGRTLLVHAEQGFGDTLQFCRCVALAASRGWRVVVEVPPPLRRLLQGLAGAALVLAPGDMLPEFDLHCPMLSLPLALGITLENIPAAMPYLHADAAAQAAWRVRLGGTGRRVGLVWAGTAQTPTDARRSLDPARLAPLLEIGGVTFVSLQKHTAAVPPITDVMAEVGDFADTAALVANLDLVIAVDTAVAHLAAGMGKEVWLLDRFDPCWRWLRGRRDSPWYPTLRLYRQARPGDWDGVLAEVAGDLRRFAHG